MSAVWIIAAQLVALAVLWPVFAIGKKGAQE